MANNLTKKQLLNILQIKAGIPLNNLTPADQAKYKNILETKRITLAEALDVIDLTTQSLVTSYNEALKSIDVLEYILAHTLDISEETFDKAEKEVTALNDKAREEAVKAFQDKIKELRDKQNKPDTNEKKANMKVVKKGDK